MHITTRRGQPRDIDWIISCLRDFDVAVNRKKAFFEDEAFARKGISDFIQNHVVFVAERGSELLGFIIGWQTPHPFNPKIRVLTETFWWVPPEHRRTRAGYLLLNEFENHGRQFCDWVIFTVENITPLKEKHLEKRGFVPKERSYLLEVA